MKIALSVANMAVGGIPTFVLNLGQRLCHTGHSVTVIAQEPGVWWSRLAENGIKSHCLPPRPWTSVHQQAQRFAAYLTEQKFDLLMVHIGINNRLPMLALHLLPDALPVVLALRNDRPEVYRLAALNRAAWNCAVGVGPKVQENAVKHLIKPVHCILNGVELPTTTQLDARLAWRTPLRLLFVGRLNDQQKGIFRLPAMLAACRQRQLPVQLTVIGDGPDRAPLLRLFQAAGVADLVAMEGFQPNAAALAQMRAHHLLLLPSNFEGLATVLREAQANGCVPIASCLPGITDATITDGVNGKLVEPTDIAGFVKAIRFFLTPANWHTYSQSAINHAYKDYSTPIMAERYLSLFEAVVQGAHPLPVARSSLRQQGVSPFSRRDYLPKPLWLVLQKLLSLRLNRSQSGNERAPSIK